MALAPVADYVHNFLIESHAHLRFILHGMKSSYGLMKDGCRIGIGTVTVEDDTHESRTASLCLRYVEDYWELHDLRKGSSVRCIISHDGAKLQ